jgi:B-cell receptor-associated protein 31
MAEMLLFMLLIMPLPFTFKRTLFTYVPPSLPPFHQTGSNHMPDRFISENPVVAKIQYWMKITFIFILILFIDSINRVYRVQADLIAAKHAESTGYVYPNAPIP